MIPNNVVNIIQQFVPNAGQLNVNTPDEFAQMMLNSKRVNQQQVNLTRQMWQQPNVRQMIMNRFFK